MPAKTCQLDIIPTDRLNQVLEGCLPAFTHITNKSLDTKQFCEEWKDALVKLSTSIYPYNKQITRHKAILWRMERCTSQTPHKKPSADLEKQTIDQLVTWDLFQK